MKNALVATMTATALALSPVATIQAVAAPAAADRVTPEITAVAFDVTTQTEEVTVFVDAGPDFYSAKIVDIQMPKGVVAVPFLPDILGQPRMLVSLVENYVYAGVLNGTVTVEVTYRDGSKEQVQGDAQLFPADRHVGPLGSSVSAGPGEDPSGLSSTAGVTSIVALVAVLGAIGSIALPVVSDNFNLLF